MYPSPATKPDAEAFCPQHLFLTVDLIPEEPLLIQAPIPRIPDPAAPLFGPGRSSDADFVTALVAPAGTNGKLAERQYIPGSSLKGVLRTRAEKIVRTLSFCRRGVDTTTDEGYRTAQTSYAERICACAVTHSEQDGDFPEPERLLACFGTVEKQRAAQRKAREIAASQQKDTTFARALYDKSCVTCRLFGNTMMQGRLHVGDTTLVAEPQPKLFDHVAIDRFHGGAEDKQKFDTRPLMPTATVDANHNPPPTFQPMFSLRLHLERFEPWMLGLLGYLLKDLRTADLRLGHATHRGYGRIRGKITSGELLVLPNSALESLCVAHEVLPPEQEQRQRFGPYWRVRLDLRQLFGGDAWPQEGLQGEALNTPTAKLLLACAQKLREELIPREEGKVHGSF
jgi:CRISPR/Cas system CSM-associated protein Csm3 (group 7 of RAMP superfamily)